MRIEYELSSLGSRSWHYYKETGEDDGSLRKNVGRRNRCLLLPSLEKVFWQEE